jgi:hypothetical protein
VLYGGKLKGKSVLDSTETVWFDAEIKKNIYFRVVNDKKLFGLLNAVDFLHVENE